MGTPCLAKDEFIGQTVCIKDCTDPTWVGLTGLIVDETKNTFVIETKNKRKVIAKKTAIIEIEYQGNMVLVDGKRLAYRPEDRIKKAR